MPKKTYAKNNKSCKVTFSLPAEAGASKAALAGEFNDWEPKAMKKLKDGSFSVTVSLEPGREYRYRYLVDGERWENDWAADRYSSNPFGQEDSIIEV